MFRFFKKLILQWQNTRYLRRKAKLNSVYGVQVMGGFVYRDTDSAKYNSTCDYSITQVFKDPITGKTIILK